MNFAWDLPKIMKATPDNVRLSERVLERVLIEYEGPQLVVLKDSERRFLGYAVDESDGLVRWIHVPVTNVELKALHRGKLTLREALEKSELTICDVSDSGDIANVWLSPPASVPSECLPDAGVELPEFARIRSSSEASRLAFECEGSAVAGHSITFECLGAVVSSLQRLWRALAPRSGVLTDDSSWNKTTLAFAAGGAGSFAIEVDDRERTAFNAIAREYKRIVHASYNDPSALYAELSQVPQLSSAYGDYVEALETHGIDIFADWTTDAAFLSNDRAKRLAKSYGRRNRRSLRLEQPAASVETVTVEGYFDGLLRRRKKFELVDPDAGRDYVGDIDDDAAQRLQEMDVTLGRHNFYRATIEISRLDDGRAKFVLLEVRETGQLRLRS